MAIITPEYEQIVQGITKRHKYAVWSVLANHIGRENKIARKLLVQRVREIIARPKYHERGVRKILETFRDAGLPVASDKNGYWLGTPADVYEWSQWYKAHALTMLNIMNKQMRLAIRLDHSGEIKRKAKRDMDDLQITLNLEGSES